MNKKSKKKKYIKFISSTFSKHIYIFLKKKVSFSKIKKFDPICKKHVYYFIYK
ncbi:50S ribosomal protein L33 [Candidatus Vidania fulgoroideorum]